MYFRDVLIKITGNREQLDVRLGNCGIFLRDEFI